MTLRAYRYRALSGDPRTSLLQTGVSLCQVATQVFVYVPTSPLPFSRGLKSPTKGFYANVLNGARKDANAPLNSLLLALSSVVESSPSDDGGRSATLLLVAFPLPSRSLLAGPIAAISPRTRKIVLSVNSARKIEKHDGHFPDRDVSSVSRRCFPSVFSNCTVSHTLACEFAIIFYFQVPVDVRTRWFHEGLAKNQRSWERQVWSLFFFFFHSCSRYKSHILRSRLRVQLRNRRSSNGTSRNKINKFLNSTRCLAPSLTCILEKPHTRVRDRRGRFC